MLPSVMGFDLSLHPCPFPRSLTSRPLSCFTIFVGLQKLKEKQAKMKEDQEAKTKGVDCSGADPGNLDETSHSRY